MGPEPYVLSSLEDVTSLYGPLKTTQRIKYTCFTVSKNYIIFGATSGGLYVFSRESYLFLHLIPNKEGPVARVISSPDEHLFAFATVKGAVCMLERNTVPGSRPLHTTLEHVGSEVTALCWGPEYELYIGDFLGRVSVLCAPDLAKNVFTTPSFHLMQLDSCVVQMDEQDGFLLVSTRTRSYLCDTAKEQYKQIGQTPRVGEFGGCFAKHMEGREPHMFCARPGSRIWEVSLDGTVLHTHQFKLALAVPPQPVLNYSSHMLLENVPYSNMTWSQQSFNFAKLLTLSDNFLFTFKADGLYIFDPYAARVVLWNDSFTDIVDAETVDNTIYVWTSAGRMHVLSLYPLEKFLLLLFFHKQYRMCGLMCILYGDWLLSAVNNSSKLCILADLLEKLKNDNDLIDKLSPILQGLTTNAINTHIFDNHELTFMPIHSHISVSSDGNSCPITPQSRQTEYLKDKSRSLSLSPDRKCSHKLGTHSELQNSKKYVSHSSLPDVANSLSDQPQLLVDSNMNKLVKEKTGENYLEPRSKVSDNIQISARSSQEAVQALKEIGHSVTWKIANGTKSLKQKWQFLEDRVKSLTQETTSQISDIEPTNHQADDSEIYLRSSSYVKRLVEFPKLDVCDLISISNKYNRNDIDEMEALRMSFCNIVIAISSEYNHLVNSTTKHIENTEDHQSSLQFQDSTKITNEIAKQILATEKPFPFNHYLLPEKIQALKLLFRDMLKFNSLVSYLQNFVADIDAPESSLKYFLGVVSEDCLKIDILISKFLLLCSQIIDSETILDDLRKLNLPCYFYSFSTLLDIFQSGPSTCLVSKNSAKSSDSSSWSELLLLNALFITLRMGQTEMCSSVGKELCLKDICYLALKLEDYLVKLGEEEHTAKQHCQSLFLSSLVKLQNLSNSVLDSLQDDFLVHYVTTAFKALNKNCLKTCNCGYPLETPDSKEIKFSEVGTVVLDYFQRTNNSQAILLCRSVPALWFHVLHKKSKISHSDIPLIVQLGSIEHLEGCVPQSCTDFWDHVLSLVFIFRSGTCLNCESRFPVERTFCGSLSFPLLGALIVKSLGPFAAVQLLKKYGQQLHPGELDAKFYQSCIFTAMVNVYQSGLQSSVVDRIQGLPGHSPKVATLSHQAADKISKALCEDGFVLKQAACCHDPERAESHHWGARLRLSQDVCALCSLPLGSLVLLAEGHGITVYPCSHSYHSVCLRKKPETCPLCN